MAKRATDVDVYVGRRVRQRRLELGQSQTQLADALGTSYQQIQKYEGGTNRVSAGRLNVLAQALRVTIDYFFEGTAGSFNTGNWNTGVGNIGNGGT